MGNPTRADAAPRALRNNESRLRIRRMPRETLAEIVAPPTRVESDVLTVDYRSSTKSREKGFFRRAVARMLLRELVEEVSAGSRESALRWGRRLIHPSCGRHHG